MASLVKRLRYHNSKKTFRKYLTNTVFKRREKNGKFMDFINANPDKNWDWNGISRNPNITMEIINKNLDKPWKWFWISHNPNITMEMINSNPDKPWDWNSISCN